jgi:hypothetical protein
MVLTSPQPIIVLLCEQTAATVLQIHEHLSVGMGVDGLCHNLRCPDGLPSR